MKILHIILTQLNGGAEQVFIDYIRILKKIGHQNFAVIKQNAPYENQIKDLDIPYQKIFNKYGYYDFFAIKEIRQYINNNKIDAVIAHAGKSIILAHKAVKKISNKHVILVAVNHSYNIKRSLVADLIVSVNREIFYKTIDSKRTPENSFILYNAIDFDINKKINFNKNLKSASSINIGCLGRFVDSKGFNVIIQTIFWLKHNSNYNFKLKIAGDGKEKTNLIKLVKQLDLNDSVEFMGWLSDSSIFYSQIDIFTLPSKIETFGLVILEAMKFGVPIIATSCDGPKEILRANIDGILIDKSNKKDEDLAIDFGKNIIKLIDEDLASIHVNNAYERLNNRFTFTILERNLADIFKIEKNKS